MARAFVNAAGGNDKKIDFAQFKAAVRELARDRFPDESPDAQWDKAVALIKIMCPCPGRSPLRQVRVVVSG